MEQLNYRFLNYKKYNTFAKDLADEKIREDAIVFVQDKPCIWARGKEYVCDGPNTADIQSGTFTFKNGKDQIIFSASLEDGVITLTDGNGNVVSLEYVLKDWFDSAIRTISQSVLSNTSSINSLNDNYINLARDKQNKLIAGENIRIKDNVISAVVDTDLYIITQSLDGIENPNPNKIYLLETVDQDNKVIYQQYKYQDGEWIPVGVADTNINMSEYLEQEYRYLQENYQPKGDYANRAWTENTFVKKTSVDENLSTTSSNPVENRTVTIALLNKVDNVALLLYAKKSDIVDKVNSSALNDYVTNIQHAQDLNSKLNLLTAGNGISINNNLISVTLDTDFMVVIRSLESVLNPNPNKIYLLEHTEDENTIYTEYRYNADNSEWIEIGKKYPEINLEPYMTKVEAQAIHQNITDNYLTKAEAQIANQNIIDNYLTKAEAEANYQTIIDDYVTKDELELVDQKLEDYANKSWVEDTFVKKSSVYTPQDGISDGGSESGGGSSDIIIPSGNSNIIVDKNLSTISSNPVENRTVTIALQGKADSSLLQQYAKKSDIINKVDASELNNYVTNILYLQDLEDKQGKLVAGNGISIDSNGTISVTLDTDFMVITKSLQSITSPNPNKIYLFEHESGGKIVYTEYRYDNNSKEWIEIGEKIPEINLEPYMTKEEAQIIHKNITDNYLSKLEALSTYLTIISDYVTKDELAVVNNRFGNYATTRNLDDIVEWAKNTFNSKITIDRNLSTLSANPVENRTITTALQEKVDTSQLYQYAKKSEIVNKVDVSELNNYVTNTQHLQDLEGKQEKLIAGDGISISQDGRISAVVNVDKNLNSLSTNPVENKVVTTELQKKADSSQLLQYVKKSEIVNKVDASTLNNYVTKVQHYQDLESKQKKLTAGDGISISSDGKISVTLDTDFMIITRSLQGITNPNPNKIYLLEHEVDGEISYTEYRYNGDSQEWIEVGERAPEINLEPYMTKAEAQIAHQNITDNYLSKAEAQSTYQTIINDYVTKDEFEDAIDNITESEDTISLNLTSLLLEISDVDSKINTEIADRETAIDSILNNKQDKLTAGEGINITNNTISVIDYIGEKDINGKLRTLQQMLGEIYVLKTDVYKPENSNWSEAPIYSFGDIPVSGGGETPTNSNIYALDESSFNILELNNQLRNDVCYLITD